MKIKAEIVIIVSFAGHPLAYIPADPLTPEQAAWVSESERAVGRQVSMKRYREVFPEEPRSLAVA